MDFAAFEIGKANSVVAEIVWCAFRAKTIGVDFALRVSDLAFTVGIEEIKSVAVHADTIFIKLPAMFVSILATSISIEFVPFFAFLAGSLLSVIVKTVWILNEAKIV